MDRSGRNEDGSILKVKRSDVETASDADLRLVVDKLSSLGIEGVEDLARSRLGVHIEEPLQGWPRNDNAATQS